MTSVAIKVRFICRSVCASIPISFNLDSAAFAVGYEILSNIKLSQRNSLCVIVFEQK